MSSLLRSVSLAARAGLLASAMLSASLVLTGCGATLGGESFAVSSTSSSSQGGPYKKPEPVRLATPTFEAFTQDGIFYFDDNRRSELKLGAPDKKGAYPIVESFPKGASHGFSWGSGAVAILRNGQPLDAHPKATLTNDSAANVVRIRLAGANDKTPLELKVKLIAYSLEGVAIGPYLVTRQNTSTTAGYIISSRHTFPKGAVGYRAVVSTDRDEVLVPTRTAFTGSNSIEAFSSRFTHDIPYCLRYIPGASSEPIGMRFQKAIVKQTKKVGKSLQEVGQSGEAQLFPVKKGTIFCAAEGKTQLSSAAWRLRYVNGTRVLDFTFPYDVSAPNFGILEANRGALLPAFAEEKNVEQQGRRKTVAVTKVRPAVVWLANTEVQDAQWRFNRIAADAISEAIERTKADREAFEAQSGAKK